jgi:two-component system sensor histidine kinase KdpD
VPSARTPASTEDFDLVSGFSIPLRQALGARRPWIPARLGIRFLPEWVALAAALILTLGIIRLLRWPWLAAALAGFLIAGVGLVIYGLMARATRDAREAESAMARMRRVYELTRRTLDIDLHVEPGPRLVSLVHEIFELNAVALFDADLQEVYEAGHWNSSPLEMVQNVYHFGTSDDDRTTGISRRVVLLGSVPVGSLLLKGDTTPVTNSAIAALIAITFDRYRALANESRIEAEREAEQLRATVLDSLAHDYKTPLTAIRAASTGLSEMGRLTPAQAELVNLIDEQASLLNDLTTRLLTTARLESADGDEGAAGVTLQIAPQSVQSLIDEAVENLAEHSDGVDVRVQVPDETLVLDCDRRLVLMLLAQYLDNACKYADFDSTVTVGAQKSDSEVVFSVHSHGPVIPMADRERIFDRYFRSSASAANASGTGIGLSIAKRVALSHGGSVWVSSDEAQGTTFFAALPGYASASSAEHVLSTDSSSDCGTRDSSISRSVALPHSSPAIQRSMS